MKDWIIRMLGGLTVKAHLKELQNAMHRSNKLGRLQQAEIYERHARDLNGEEPVDWVNSMWSCIHTEYMYRKEQYETA